MQEDRLWLWLHMATGHNALLFEQVHATYPNLEEAFQLAKAGDKAAFAKWSAAFYTRLRDVTNDTLLDEKQAWLEKNGISLLPDCNQAYPALLKETSHPPPVLYLKGSMKAAPKLPIAIIGMRRNTQYGESVARHLAKELVHSGATVVSGMALGIDSHAAQGALSVEEAKLPTIAVLGCGVDVIYPTANARLYYEIIERGAVVSEFLPGTKPLREHFPIRNRVISGLSRGVVVVEAAARSGTTITANHALEQGRDVFAVPGRITDEASFGPNGMIQRGEAKPVFCAADILCEYGLSPAKHKPIAEVDTSSLAPVEASIVQELQRGEYSADELCENLSLPIALVNSCLTSLQFSGIIKQLPGRVFGL